MGVKRKRMVDFCCKAGGTSMGYHMAGFEVVGVDLEDQPHFPFEFFRCDIKEITDRQIANIRKNFDAVGASPPCKFHTPATRLDNLHRHEDLIPHTRWLLQEIGLPYIIENVPTAPLIKPVLVCGSALSLRVRRHRKFESNVPLVGTGCDHQWQDRHKPYLAIRNGPGSEEMTGVIQIYGGGDGTHLNGLSQIEIWRVAMGIDWMTMGELNQAIPPAYTYHLGKQLMSML